MSRSKQPAGGHSDRLADNNDLILIGRIAEAHGLKGFVKIRFYGEDESLLTHADGVIVDNHNAVAPKPSEKAIKHRKADQHSFIVPDRIEIKIIKSTDKALICQIKDVKDRNQAEAICKRDLYLEREKFPDIESDGEESFYVTDLIGMDVHSHLDDKIGVIKAVDNFGAGDLLLIKPIAGASISGNILDGGEFYLPFTKELVPDLKFDEGFVQLGDIQDYLVSS